MESPLRPPPDPGFRLIETFRWEPGKGIIRRNKHLARLTRSAAAFGIDLQGVNAALDRLSGSTPLRVRLTVDAAGRAEVTTAAFAPLPEGTVWRIAIAPERLAAGDPWLRVKTTQRHLYDTARASLPEGVDEFIFLNERAELCDGTITNLFARIGPDLMTPPVSCGLLPGVLREVLLSEGRAIERTLTTDDLSNATALYVGNSLRGLIPARLVHL
ncbi:MULTISPECIES: aminotransferase class IV family protein [unclassified Roseovarius]|uniref:aminotransferase class IV family protein n=1 Tax=unclassified Roseovarius TaxID=2614913 RepID=UPI00273D4701|nr:MULTISPECIES: aminotransferase class IV family protein [unclassified Roseovarius]